MHACSRAERDERCDHERDANPRADALNQACREDCGNDAENGSRCRASPKASVRKDEEDAEQGDGCSERSRLGNRRGETDNRCHAPRAVAMEARFALFLAQPNLKGEKRNGHRYEFARKMRRGCDDRDLPGRGQRPDPGAPQR